MEFGFDALALVICCAAVLYPLVAARGLWSTNSLGRSVALMFSGEFLALLAIAFFQVLVTYRVLDFLPYWLMSLIHLVCAAAAIATSIHHKRVVQKIIDDD